MDYCLDGGSSFGADWCDDPWCYVDPAKCDQHVYVSSYFPNAELYFSYQSCDADFAGNTWVGSAATCQDLKDAHKGSTCCSDDTAATDVSLTGITASSCSTVKAAWTDSGCCNTDLAQTTSYFVTNLDSRRKRQLHQYTKSVHLP
jgi:hypothetical protein